ncbi:MAG: ATP-binding cassette domain-containing protein [Candidatus Palauibacterales bacterium]|nr:ATP-binding cassette domain-containing protein [Candidatus Palauibacterales bacterium]
MTDDGNGAGERDEPMVRAENVTLSLGGRRVLDGVSFELTRGESLAILGASGSGKTTLLRLVLALAEPDEGEIWVAGYPLSRCSFEDILKLRRDIGMVFQGSALFDSMSVLENVAFPLREYTDLPDPEIRERVHETLRIVDLDPDQVEHQLPAELSGGMQKRVAIARAIAPRPDMLLFDEPTGGLDPITTRTINELIVKLREELGVSAIVVTHDIRSALHTADRVALLHEGRLVFVGTPAEMKESKDDYVQEFLGEALFT